MANIIEQAWQNGDEITVLVKGKAYIYDKSGNLLYAMSEGELSKEWMDKNYKNLSFEQIPIEIHNSMTPPGVI